MNQFACISFLSQENNIYQVAADPKIKSDMEHGRTCVKSRGGDPNKAQQNYHSPTDL